MRNLDWYISTALARCEKDSDRWLSQQISRSATLVHSWKKKGARPEWGQFRKLAQLAGIADSDTAYLDWLNITAPPNAAPVLRLLQENWEPARKVLAKIDRRFLATTLLPALVALSLSAQDVQAATAATLDAATVYYGNKCILFNHSGLRHIVPKI